MAEKRQHVNGQHDVGQQTLVENQKSSTKTTVNNKFWDVISSRELFKIHERCLTSLPHQQLKNGKGKLSTIQ